MDVYAVLSFGAAVLLSLARDKPHARLARHGSNRIEERDRFY